MVICMERGANDLHMVQLMPLPPHHLLLQQNPEWLILLVPAYPGCPRKKAVKRLCVCVFTAVMKVISVIMFGLGAEYDQYWMPNPEYNYPHFSYGMAIISAFSTIFSSMAHQVYHGIVLKEYRQPALQRGPLRSSYNI